jgi:hypothetical protein
VKKATAIVLAFVFLFNVIGYYAIYATLLRNANAAMDKQIESNHYDQDLTFTVKIPLTLPYPVQQNVYERVSGDFEYQGEFYKLVEQKYSNDTVYVTCLKNVGEKNAHEVLSSLVKLSTDQSATPNQQNTKVLSGLIKDYNPVLSSIVLFPRESIASVKSFTFFNSHILSQDLTVFSPPPEFVC